MMKMYRPKRLGDLIFWEISFLTFSESSMLLSSLKSEIEDWDVFGWGLGLGSSDSEILVFEVVYLA